MEIDQTLITSGVDVVQWGSKLAHWILTLSWCFYFGGVKIKHKDTKCLGTLDLLSVDLLPMCIDGVRAYS